MTDEMTDLEKARAGHALGLELAEAATAAHRETLAELHAAQAELKRVEDLGYVVVVFGVGTAEGYCELSHCPMHAIGPFRTSDEAKAATVDLPAWTQPHVLRVQADL